ncbi:hypothetical protein Ciccas_012231, partial [Cichlidogyrus casuarinus]
FFFTAEPQPTDVQEGQEFRLDCSVQPDNGVHYIWYRLSQETSDRREVVDFKKENGRVVERGHSLIVTHADRRLDDSYYQCRAINGSSNFDIISKPAKVNVFG